MKKSQGELTTANNLEEKFDRGENVLDYFDISKARVIRPETKTREKKLTHSPKANSDRRAIVREKSARYRGKK